jgi:hypothetical protein
MGRADDATALHSQTNVTGEFRFLGLPSRRRTVTGFVEFMILHETMSLRLRLAGSLRLFMSRAVAKGQVWRLGLS